MLRHRPTRSAAAAALVVALAGCGAASAAHAPSSSHTASASASASSSLRAPSLKPAPLGAPLMIQVENLYAARPQSGLSSASILYEYDTEGGITRFTAFWFTPPPASESIGPVRSARLVDLRLLQIYGGVLLYSGASNYTLAKLRASTLRSYSPDSALVGSRVLFRISSRAAPHNLYTDGSVLQSFEQSVKMGTVGYQLWQRTQPSALPAGAAPASSFQVPLTQYERPIFTYDSTHGAYERSEPGSGAYPATGILKDADTGLPWEVPNVVVLQVPVITVAADNEDAANIPWTDGLDFGIGPGATGSGQLAVGGQLYPISWNQGATGPPQLTLASGQAAPLVPGQVLFELVPQGSTVSVLSTGASPSAG